MLLTCSILYKIRVICSKQPVYSQQGIQVKIKRRNISISLKLRPKEKAETEDGNTVNF